MVVEVGRQARKEVVRMTFAMQFYPGECQIQFTSCFPGRVGVIKYETTLNLFPKKKDNLLSLFNK